MNKIIIVVLVVFCLVSCKKDQILTDVKLVANDSIARDAQLMIDGYLIDIFSKVDDSENVDPCLNPSENFPVISLNPNHTALGKSYYDFVIISKDYRNQLKGTKIIEDGVCQKWVLRSPQLKPVVDAKYEIQGMVNVSDNNCYVKVYDENNSSQAILKIILNDEEVISNFNTTKEVWEENIFLDNGMNFIAIESILEGDQSETPVISYIEISSMEVTQTFKMETINDKPGAFLIASTK